MYYYLRGTVTIHGKDSIVVECNGVGYEVLVSHPEDYNIGDTIRITTVDGNEYLYVVDEILTILPEELEDMIGPDVSDERQITLVTCTPTGVGSHRLLIIGHMVEENN